MNNDKLEVSRELADRLIKGDASKGANALQLIDAWKAMEELRALLAVPAVERQPVYQVEYVGGYAGWRDVDFGTFSELKNDGRYKARALYTAPPELAELQATIGQPRSERKPFGWWRVPKRYPLQGAFFSYVEGESERDVQNSINHEFGFNVKWLYDEPATQHQGEPVAPYAWAYEWARWISTEGPKDFKACIERETPPQWAIESGQARNVIKLYAEQPAPVAVAPDNLLSHRNSWLRAMERLVDLEPESGAPDEDEKGFWRHELKAMRDMYADLDRIALQ